jgi:hypothetical protein
MANIKSFYRRAKKVNVDQVIQNVFENKKDELLEQNKKQLFEGFNAKGKRLREYQNADYAFAKYASNPLPGLGNPDFFVTGAFYRGWAIMVRRTELINEFEDEKSDQLLKRDPGIAGLGGNYKTSFIQEDLRPEFMKQIRKPYGL